jgi:hypothetical protein
VTIPAAERLHLREEEGGVRIPLEWNRNDKGCLFAGSIYAGAIIAAYRAAEQRYAALGLEGGLVAKRASVRYLKSLVSDGRAASTACGEPQRKPNGNWTVSVTVMVSDPDGVPCAELDAEMVLMRKRDACPP